MRRVDNNMINLALRAEPHDRPIHMFTTRALSFPPVAHVFAAAWEEQVVFCAEVLV
jgi:hypothetical protein